MLLRQIVNSFSVQVSQVRENVELPTNVIKYVLHVFGIHFYYSYWSLFVVHVPPITSPQKVTCSDRPMNPVHGRRKFFVPLLLVLIRRNYPGFIGTEHANLLLRLFDIAMACRLLYSLPRRRFYGSSYLEKRATQKTPAWEATFNSKVGIFDFRV